MTVSPVSTPAATPARSSDVETNWPMPVRCRATSAAQMALTAAMAVGGLLVVDQAEQVEQERNGQCPSGEGHCLWEEKQTKRLGLLGKTGSAL
jgi:hypothetical protein